MKKSKAFRNDSHKMVARQAKFSHSRKLVTTGFLLGIMATSIVGCKPEVITKWGGTIHDTVYIGNDTVYTNHIDTVYIGPDTIYTYQIDTIYLNPPHDTILYFSADDYSQITRENVLSVLARPDIDNVTLKVGNEDFTRYTGWEEIHTEVTIRLYNAYYTKVRDIYPEGNMQFKKGQIRDADSLSFVYWGWTVNARSN